MRVRLMRLLKLKKVKLILISLILVCLLHYLIPRQELFYHELFRRLYYFPIFLGGFWYGLRGGLGVGLLVALLYLPQVFMALGQGQPMFYSRLMEMCLFALAGPVVGLLSDRERRQRLRNQELETLAALGEAAASVAHEMKNIVIPIRGFLRRIREADALDSKASEYLDIAERESARLENMTKDMLAFARQAPLQREEVEIRSLLEELRASLQIHFKEKRVRLTFACEPQELSVSIDRERIRHALLNLLQNALHASTEGKEVRLTAAMDGDSVKIAVEDQGKGIPREDMDRIFLPFFSTKPKGTGLGLAITHAIVREHGGGISVESVVEKGTRILVELPITRIQPPVHESAPVEGRP